MLVPNVPPGVRCDFPEVREARLLKKKAHQKALSNNCASYWKDYRRIRNSSSLKIKICKSRYLSSLLKDNDTSSNFWKELSYLSDSGSSSDMFIPGVSSNDLNNYFLSIPHLTTRDIPDGECPTSFLQHYDLIGTPTFSFHPVTENDIVDIIRNLEVNKATGVDSIPPILIKKYRLFLSKPLSVIINRSLDTGIFWKRSIIIPIKKKKNISDLTNYRPISILPSASKIIERIAHRQLTDHFLSHNLLSPF